ncbi:Hypothetical protein SMAX5B_022377 [Scophthalmus maximus]|uniref:Uncharacterized protein n=1 Tax=Scophthalmus maximus TaxID=52904 RepID=A0A2U9C1Z8_SCOMX|nr:Hypothetical protein SMAX5B_022377 [Scophthalmus maximus]
MDDPLAAALPVTRRHDINTSGKGLAIQGPPLAPHVFQTWGDIVRMNGGRTVQQRSPCLHRSISSDSQQRLPLGRTLTPIDFDNTMVDDLQDDPLLLLLRRSG